LIFSNNTPSDSNGSIPKLHDYVVSEETDFSAKYEIPLDYFTRKSLKEDIVFRLKNSIGGLQYWQRLKQAPV